MQYDFDRPKRKTLTREAILLELERVAEQFNYIEFGWRDFAAASTMSGSTPKNEFGSWSKALDALKLTLQANGKDLAPRPHAPNRIYSDKDLFEEMDRVWQQLGFRPARTDWETADPKISLNTYKKRFGTWGNACMQFIEYKMGKQVVVDEPVKKAEAAIKPAKTKQKQSRDISLTTRLKVLQRDNFKCVFCGRSPANTPGLVLHIDHKHPYSKGGSNDISNLQTLCQDCNLGKLDKIVKSDETIAANSLATNAPIPEVGLQINGKGADSTFIGHVSGKGQMLVAESIEIMDEKTVLEQQFSKLFFLENLRFPANIFVEEVAAVPVKLIYRTLDGQRFAYLLTGEQKPMVIGKYNIEFNKPARIERLPHA